MIVYCVIQRYFDDGKVRATIAQLEAETIPTDRIKEFVYCDVYHDYFVSKEKAREYYEQVLKA